VQILIKKICLLKKYCIFVLGFSKGILITGAMFKKCFHFVNIKFVRLLSARILNHDKPVISLTLTGRAVCVIGAFGSGFLPYAFNLRRLKKPESCITFPDDNYLVPY